MIREYLQTYTSLVLNGKTHKPDNPGVRLPINDC